MCGPRLFCFAGSRQAGSAAPAGASLVGSVSGVPVGDGVACTGVAGPGAVAIVTEMIHDARIVPLPGHAAAKDSAQRWDKANLHAFEGAYGDYLMGKVRMVFPDLAASVSVTRASSP